MDWTAPVDIYCERLGPGLWAEPLNAASNIAFFIAAWIGWRAGAGRDWRGKVLIALTAAVGTGSTLFHTFAQRWAGAADVIPILLLILAYFGFALWRWFGARPAEAAALVLAFPFFGAGLQRAAEAALPEAMAPTFGYLPAIALLAACGALLMLRRAPAGVWIFGGAVVFAISLTFRALDMPLCDAHPHGVHIFWHLLNGVLLGMLLLAWARHGAVAEGTRRR